MFYFVPLENPKGLDINHFKNACCNPNCQKVGIEKCECEMAHFCVDCLRNGKFITPLKNDRSILKAKIGADIGECSFDSNEGQPGYQWWYKCIDCFPNSYGGEVKGKCQYCVKNCITDGHHLELRYGSFICSSKNSKEYANFRCANPDCIRVLINENIAGIPNFCYFCKYMHEDDQTATFCCSPSYPLFLCDLNDELTDCVYNLKGERFYNMWWYNCYNCFDDRHEGVCLYCVQNCRKKGHKLKLRFGPFFCDKLGKVDKEENQITINI